MLTNTACRAPAHYPPLRAQATPLTARPQDARARGTPTSPAWITALLSTQPPYRNEPSEPKARNRQSLRPFPLGSAPRAEPPLFPPRGGGDGAALRASGRATGTSSGNRARGTAPLRSPAQPAPLAARSARPQPPNRFWGRPRLPICIHLLTLQYGCWSVPPPSSRTEQSNSN